eukprot:gnl/TRDRNA2_/TRDRNA2_172419_c1_seq3.p3 gnl/TRDRNA2_/TRDRNA2_172419_c1~~gnl/TRDRNA2_/TRDRNA2_172419_c1_seq3.p3  ORF type:complete len:120 (+),score=40.03 gnl/TRDRNA2_/TRDRNA2_172419_c1_seq3:334-693(+)
MPESKDAHWSLSLACSLLTTQGEQSALSFVSSVVAEQKAGYAGGGVEEDEQVLAADLSSPMRTAVAARRDEKYVLAKVELFLASAQKYIAAHPSTWGWRDYVNIASYEVTVGKLDDVEL